MKESNKISISIAWCSKVILHKSATENISINIKVNINIKHSIPARLRVNTEL